jgi:hypothetical protein
MRKLTMLASLVGLLTMAVAGSALAGKPSAAPDPCQGGTLAPGTYGALTFTHDCVIDSMVTIDGNVVVANGVYLSAGWPGTMLTVNGNVDVRKGATLGLGCAFFYNTCGFVPGPPPPPWGGVNVTVNGNITANQALSVYLDWTAVHGNVVVNGGGDASMVDTGGQENGLVLPIKDNVIDGNVIVHGWAGAWFGVIRNRIGGNVMVSHDSGTRVGTDPPYVGVPDSTEVATNTIGGNLICQHNSPAAQLGDTGGAPNAVAGNKIGECTGV